MRLLIESLFLMEIEDMANSFKKHPCLRYVQKYHKNQANRKIRKFVDDISNGSDYKRLYWQYSVSDDEWHLCTFEPVFPVRHSYKNRKKISSENRRYYTK